MNIFYLDQDPVLAAQYHCDKHVVKMILETAQILSTVCRHNYDSRPGLYKPTHEHHPCVQWANLTGGNYHWLWRLGTDLCNEYTYRYGKVHKSSAVIKACCLEPDNLRQSIEHLTFPAQAMPPEYQRDDSAVAAYRAYYRGAKSSLLVFTRRRPPEWLADVATFKEIIYV